MRRLILILLILVWASGAWTQLTIRVSEYPEYTPQDEDVYLAGSINGWNPGHPDYILAKNESGQYEITISPAAGTLQYKFTRGTWASVEGGPNMEEIANRVLEWDGSEQTVDHIIQSWKDGGSSEGTAAVNVHVIDEAFPIPQLGRSRRVWVYLPPDYDQKGAYYPVLYMLDGQNLFDINTSYAGEWEVDESLNTLFDQGDQGTIVVGVDNGGGLRIDEYSPWVNAEYGGGEGEAFASFLVETLKPHIDAKYRTLSGREHTGIMGSSLGGFFSLYAAMEYQEVFSRAGIFSPSFWFSDSIYSYVENTGKRQDMCFYLMGGELESEYLAGFIADMETSLQLAGFGPGEMTSLMHADGTHSEWFWAREFPVAYEWLFSRPLSVSSAYEDSEFGLIYPNPFSDWLALGEDALSLEIYSTSGQQVYFRELSGSGPFPVTGLDGGMYIIRWIRPDGKIITRKALHQH